MVPRLIGCGGFDNADTEVAERFSDRKADQWIIVDEKNTSWQRFGGCIRLSHLRSRLEGRTHQNAL
jgi:hypothetical protein